MCVIHYDHSLHLSSSMSSLSLSPWYCLSVKYTILHTLLTLSFFLYVCLLCVCAYMYVYVCPRVCVSVCVCFCVCVCVRVCVSVCKCRSISCLCKMYPYCSKQPGVYLSETDDRPFLPLGLNPAGTAAELANEQANKQTSKQTHRAVFQEYTNTLLMTTSRDTSLLAPQTHINKTR